MKKAFRYSLWLCIVLNLQSMYQVTVLLVLNFDGTKILHLEHETEENALKKKNTLIFNAFVFCQVMIYA